MQKSKLPSYSATRADGTSRNILISYNGVGIFLWIRNYCGVLNITELTNILLKKRLTFLVFFNLNSMANHFFLFLKNVISFYMTFRHGTLFLIYLPIYILTSTLLTYHSIHYTHVYWQIYLLNLLANLFLSLHQLTVILSYLNLLI